jgi:hypothetical protein
LSDPFELPQLQDFAMAAVRAGKSRYPPDFAGGFGLKCYQHKFVY